MYLKEYELQDFNTPDHSETGYKPVPFNTSKFNVPQYGTSYFTALDNNDLDYNALDLPDCFFESPFDETKCWVTDKSWSYIKWSGIALASLFVISKAVPMVKNIKTTVSK